MQWKVLVTLKEKYLKESKEELLKVKNVEKFQEAIKWMTFIIELHFYLNNYLSTLIMQSIVGIL